MFNKRIKAWFTWKKPPATAAVAPAEAVASASAAAATPSTTSTRPPVSGITTADRPADQPRRRRRRRREPSPTGLPLYAEEPHDDEMSLFKHDGQATGSRVDLRDLSYGGGSQGHGDDGESSLYRPSMDASSTTDLQHYGRSRSASDARSLGGQSLFPYPSTPPRHSSDYTNELSRPGTHRSTHSSPALSPPSSPPIASRARSSTLRSIFTRNGSSTMLSSSPGAVSGSGRSPYGQGGNGSTARLASASSASISSQSISAPLQHTLVSSSFIFPKSGPTASQIAFISSRESLGAYGYGDGVAQIPDYVEGYSPSSEPAPITSSASMTVPVVGGGGRFRASSVSSQLSIGSSPLARTVSAPEPVSPTTDDSEGIHHLPLPTDPPIPSYDELHPPSPSPPTESPSLPFAPASSPPTMTLTLPPPLSISLPPSTAAADDSPSSTPLNSAFATPRSHSPSPGNGSVAHTPKNGIPPTLPALVFFNATPTASAAPSPIIPGGAHEEERIPSTTRREQNFSAISEASFMSQGSWATAPSVSSEATRDV